MEYVQSRRKAFEVLQNKRGSRSLSISETVTKQDYKDELEKYSKKIEGDTASLNTEEDAVSKQNRNLEIVYKALEKIKNQMKYVKESQTQLGRKLEEYESMQSHQVTLTPVASPE